MRLAHVALVAATTVAVLAVPASALLPGEQPTAPADPTDPLSQGGGTSPFHDGLVWGLGLGGAGLAAGLGVLYFLGVGGLRHVDRNNVLEHGMRQELLETIQTRPGVHLRELATHHGTAVTNTQWHLRKLEMAGLVKTQKVQGRRLYYPVQGGSAVKTIAIENAALSNPNAARVTEYLSANGGCSQRSLAEALNMNPGTVRWHLRKLESAGLVRSLQEGAQTRYFLMRVAPTRATARMAEQPMLVEQ
jgi:predicted transcriptional regulator